MLESYGSTGEHPKPCSLRLQEGDPDTAAAFLQAQNTKMYGDGFRKLADTSFELLEGVLVLVIRGLDVETAERCGIAFDVARELDALTHLLTRFALEGT